ncbi:beta-L-arabinofuranosidase domain-containing protein [Sphingobacterium puteale]|uniref:glycoside hydrolase family 127 protein n=1 Tax=Sphingobacterium puteale TaxID=2420510 RepID=UPI003D98D53C
MKKLKCYAIMTSLLAIAFFAESQGQTKEVKQYDYPIEPVSFVDVRFTDRFWAPRLKINQQVTIPIALQQCYSTGRVDNFKKAAGMMKGYFNTEYPFDDTDIYKIIEGMAYSVQTNPNAALEQQMDSLIYYIGKAQEPDGYLFTARTAAEPGKLHGWVGSKRWEKDPDLSHELYNAGHLYEAAVAHYMATGKRSLLDIAIRNADLLVKDFLVGGLKYEPGHQIVEMGLAKMYRATGKKDYLDLAKYFLDLKGKGVRGEYAQSHKPVVQQEEAVGHAVRAVYMYSGMADVAAFTGDKAYLNAIDRIWDNVVDKKYYVTGGIGARGHGEAFGDNYELPNMSAYCETCAAIGNVYWNHRQFLMHGDAKYYDVIERTLYNGVLSGVGLAGDRFFYPNPLASEGQHARSEWFGCACCPSNVCRFIPSIPGYAYAHKDNHIYVNLFVESETMIDLAGNKVHIAQTSNYPWEGNTAIQVSPEKPDAFVLLLRIPGWAVDRPVPGKLYTYLKPERKEVEIKINGQPVEFTVQANGYVSLSRQWKKGDRVDLVLPMDVKRTIANDQVKEDRGKVVLERGPIVYCLEWPDNNGKVSNAVLTDDATVESSYQSDKLNGIVTLTMNGKSTARDPQNKIVEEDKQLTAIPYYAWANRGAGEMEVWIPRTVEYTKPLPAMTNSSRAKVTSSKGVNASLAKVNDGYWPKSSSDRDVSFYALWPAKGSQEWIAYEFERPVQISRASVYWWDDRPWGGSRIPDSWRIEYLDLNGNWAEVKNTTAYTLEQDKTNTVTFEPVSAQKVRLKFRMGKDVSVGIYEFEVK